MTLIKSLFLGLILFPILASAQETAIVFIDLNNSFNEVKAARKAAQARGEKFYVFPSSDAEKPYKAAQFRKSLEKLSTEGVEITSLVVSGHHTQYSGYYGEDHTNAIHPDELREELKRFPKIRNSIRSFFGAGCHSMTKSQTQKWINYFGNLEACYGYMDIGPGNQASSAGQNIYDFLVKEAELANYNTLDRIFKSASPVLTYPYATASAMWTKSSGTYCDVKGSKQEMTNCLILEGVMEKLYALFRAKLLNASLYNSTKNIQLFGSLKEEQQLEEVRPGKFKVKGSVSAEELEVQTLDMRNQLQALCSDSPLVAQISYEDLENLKVSADLIRNHKLYFSQTIKELEKYGVRYPNDGADFEDYEKFIKKAYKTIDAEAKKRERNAKELKDSWYGFWRTVSSEHQNKIQAEERKFTKADALRSVVGFMEKQLIDRGCVTEDWKKDYKGVKSRSLIKEMSQNIRYCR